MIPLGMHHATPDKHSMYDVATTNYLCANELTLEKSQISLSDKLQEISRKFRVKFPGQNLL